MFVRAGGASSTIFILLLLVFLCQLFAAQSIDLDNKSGSKVCVGKICDDSSAFHYYECCGQLYNDCCIRLQTWVIIVLAIIVVSMIVSFLIGLIKCICCCGDRR